MRYKEDTKMDIAPVKPQHKYTAKIPTGGADSFTNRVRNSKRELESDRTINSPQIYSPEGRLEKLSADILRELSFEKNLRSDLNAERQFGQQLARAESIDGKENMLDPRHWVLIVTPDGECTPEPSSNKRARF